MNPNNWAMLADLQRALHAVLEQHKPGDLGFILESSRHFQGQVTAALIKGSVEEELVNQADMFAESLTQLSAETNLGEPAELALALSLEFAKAWSFERNTVHGASFRGDPQDIPNAKSASIDEIKHAVANHFEIDVRDLDGGSKLSNMVAARQLAMYLSRQLTSKSLPSIGRAFGNRDHTTVLYAVRRVENLRQSDESFDRSVKEISDALLNEKM